MGPARCLIETARAGGPLCRSATPTRRGPLACHRHPGGDKSRPRIYTRFVPPVAKPPCPPAPAADRSRRTHPALAGPSGAAVHAADAGQQPLPAPHARLGPGRLQPYRRAARAGRRHGVGGAAITRHLDSARHRARGVGGGGRLPAHALRRSLGGDGHARAMPGNGGVAAAARADRRDGCAPAALGGPRAGRGHADPRRAAPQRAPAAGPADADRQAPARAVRTGDGRSWHAADLRCAGARGRRQHPHAGPAFPGRAGREFFAVAPAGGAGQRDPADVAGPAAVAHRAGAGLQQPERVLGDVPARLRPEPERVPAPAGPEAQAA